MFKTKKIIIFIISVVLIVSVFVVPVSAETKTETFTIQSNKIEVQYLDNNLVSLTPLKIMHCIDLSSPFGGTFFATKNSDEDIVSNAIHWNIRSEFDYLLLLKKDTKYSIKGYFALPWDKINYNEVINLTAFRLTFYDNTLTTRFEVNTDNSVNLDSWIKSNVTYNDNNAYFGFYPFEFSFVPTENFYGYGFRVQFSFNLANPPKTGGFFGFSDLTLSYEYDDTQAIIDNQNQNTQDIIDNQDKNTDKEIQAEKDLYEQEKQEADETASQSVSDAFEVMPDYSEGIIQSFDNFLSCMLHTETNCSIEFPSIKTPAIMGIPSYTLTEPTEVNFNEFEVIIPEAILLIVRALLTIALIIFCYKELYSTIQYIVTLRNGGGT